MHNLQEASDQKRYAQQAEKLGFKLERSSGKHDIYRHESGAQVPAPKSGSDSRGFLNFRRDLKRALTNKGVELPIKPEKVKLDSISANKLKADKLTQVTRLSSSQRRIEAGNRGAITGTQTTFSDFMNKLKPVVNTVSTPNLLQRMKTAFSSNLKSGEIPKSATTASVRGNRGLSLNVKSGSGGGGLIQPVDTDINPSPFYRDLKASVQRRLDSRRSHYRGGV